MMMSVFVLLIYGGLIAAVIVLFILLSRFVRASERMAGALEDVARKLGGETKP
jgi:hypothetical protein